MNTANDTTERWKRQVEQEWRSPIVTAGYRKWSDEEAQWGRAMAELVVATGGRSG